MLPPVKPGPIWPARAAASARCDLGGDHAPGNRLAASQLPEPRRGPDDDAEPAAADIPAADADVDACELIAAQLPQVLVMHDAGDGSQADRPRSERSFISGGDRHRRYRRLLAGLGRAVLPYLVVRAPTADRTPCAVRAWLRLPHVVLVPVWGACDRDAGCQGILLRFLRLFQRSRGGAPKVTNDLQFWGLQKGVRSSLVPARKPSRSPGRYCIRLSRALPWRPARRTPGHGHRADRS